MTPAQTSRCPFLLQIETRVSPSTPGAAWQLLARERRNTSEDEIAAVYRRVAEPTR